MPLSKFTKEWWCYLVNVKKLDGAIGNYNYLHKKFLNLDPVPDYPQNTIHCSLPNVFLSQNFHDNESTNFE